MTVSVLSRYRREHAPETLPKAVPFSEVPKGQICSQARPSVLVSQGFTVPGELCGSPAPMGPHGPYKMEPWRCCPTAAGAVASGS